MKKFSINKKLNFILIAITSIMLILLGAIITLLFNKSYNEKNISNIQQQIGGVEESIENYLNQQEGSYTQLKEILKNACLATNSESIVIDRLGYVFLVYGNDYDELLYSKLEINESKENINNELMYNEKININNNKISAYIKTINDEDSIDGYIIMIPKAENDKWNNMLFIWVAVILEILISAFVISFATKKYVSEPINILNNTANKISKGEVEKRVEVRCDNEIGQLAKSFNIMAEALEQSDIKRRDFISNVSHELRSPITSIKGFIGAILDGVIPRDKENYYLKIVYDEIDRLARLVNDLLDISSMEAGKFNLTITEFDINQVISLCILNLENKIKDKGLNVKATFHENRFYVLGDRDRIIQVVTNLIENAIKYSDDNGYIKTNVYSKGVKIYVDIFNSGEGIDEKDINMIWDRFYKGDKSRTNKLSTGLGLAIVKSIIFQHNEDIWVKNIEGKGVSFIFTLKKSH